MESHELNKDLIIDYAINYASYEELESLAKAIYSVYADRRKKENLEEHKKAKSIRKKLSY